MSSTETSGNDIAYVRPVRGLIDAGLDEPQGLPTELTQTTKNRSVSIGRPGPIIDSHQPGDASAGDDVACADGESPVNSNSALSRAALRRPQLSYAITGSSSVPPRNRRSGRSGRTNRRAGNAGTRVMAWTATAMQRSL